MFALIYDFGKNIIYPNSVKKTTTQVISKELSEF